MQSVAYSKLCSLKLPGRQIKHNFNSREWCFNKQKVKVFKEHMLRYLKNIRKFAQYFFNSLHLFIVRPCNVPIHAMSAGSCIIFMHSVQSVYNNNNNNNNKHICIAPYGRNFRGAGGSRLCVLAKVPTK